MRQNDGIFFSTAPFSKSMTKCLNCHYHFALPPLSMAHNENDVFTEASVLSIAPSHSSLSSSAGIPAHVEKLSKKPVSAFTKSEAVCICVCGLRENSLLNPFLRFTMYMHAHLAVCKTYSCTCL